jgi:hypothetical protein
VKIEILPVDDLYPPGSDKPLKSLGGWITFL